MRYWYLYLFSMVCMVSAIALDMITPQITRHIIDDVIVGGQAELLMRFLFGLLGIGVGQNAVILGENGAQYAKEFTWDCVGVTIGNDMRKDLFRHVQTLSMDFFDRHNTGELMTRVKEDVDKVWAVIYWWSCDRSADSYHFCTDLHVPAESVADTCTADGTAGDRFPGDSYGEKARQCL